MKTWEEERRVAQREINKAVSRDAKYRSITTAISIGSYFHPIKSFIPFLRPVGIAPGGYVGYAFCRTIDDIADGDRELENGHTSFRELTDELKDAMRKEKYPNSNLGILLRGLVQDLKRYRGVDVREDIGRFLDAMEVEQQRRINGTISSREDLSQVYRDSFGVPQDIAFLSFRSKVRSEDVPELAEVQGRMYAVRDLEEDLAKGIVFVPKEELPQNSTVSSLHYWAQSGEGNDWVRRELEEGKELLDQLTKKDLDWRARLIISFLTRGIRRDVNARLSNLQNVMQMA